MTLITVLQQVQIPMLATMLLGGCATKLVRALKLGSMDAGLGPTALFPVRLRRPLAMLMCAIECGLGIGLIVTAGNIGQGEPANSVRLGTGVLFLVAVCALLELRSSRPDVGCGCFGDFSTAPVSWRTLARSVLLAVAALATIGLPPLRLPQPGSGAALLLGIFAAELVVIGALSPELGEGLVRLGYSEPCELRTLAVERTLTALRRSAQWRRHAGMITADVPADVWRELCWRYVVYRSRYGGREAEIVFAVYLRQRRPAVLSALVDTATGEVLPWPAPSARPTLPMRLASSLRLAQLTTTARHGPAKTPGHAPAKTPGPGPAEVSGHASRASTSPATREVRQGDIGRAAALPPGHGTVRAMPADPRPAIPALSGALPQPMHSTELARQTPPRSHAEQPGPASLGHGQPEPRALPDDLPLSTDL